MFARPGLAACRPVQRRLAVGRSTMSASRSWPAVAILTRGSTVEGLQTPRAHRRAVVRPDRGFGLGVPDSTADVGQAAARVCLRSRGHLGRRCPASSPGRPMSSEAPRPGFCVRFGPSDRGAAEAGPASSTGRAARRAFCARPALHVEREARRSGDVVLRRGRRLPHRSSKGAGPWGCCLGGKAPSPRSAGPRRAGRSARGARRDGGGSGAHARDIGPTQALGRAGSTPGAPRR
jgi:hypothetical protein